MYYCEVCVRGLAAWATEECACVQCQQDETPKRDERPQGPPSARVWSVVAVVWSVVGIACIDFVFDPHADGYEAHSQDLCGIET